MKKAWKWAAAVVGIPALCVAVLWIDSYYRAVAAIRAEDERLAVDIAKFRARRKPRIPIDSEIEGHPAALPCPMKLFMSNKRAQLDQGRSGNMSFISDLLSEDLRFSRGGLRPSLQIGSNQALSALAITEKLAQECGYYSSMLCHGFEAMPLHDLRDRLLDVAPPEELRRISETLDLALAARRSFSDVLEAEHLMNRAEVLRVLHLKADPSGFMIRPPGWREFFSWRILLVKALKELDREFEVLRSVAAGSDEEIQIARRDLEKEMDPRLTRSVLRGDFAAARDSERENHCYWTLVRVQAAIARFLADRGRHPSRLEELVPAYLPRVPVDPIGKPVEFKDSELRLQVSTNRSIDWDVRRP